MKKSLSEAPSPHKKILGAVECCTLPDLCLPLINAKIDTGAKTSALYAVDIEKYIYHKQDWVRFAVYPLKKTTEIKLHCKARIVAERNITSSGGQIERRIVISTRMSLAGTEQTIELTLSTNRDALSYRMLLGRSAMQGFLIDPTKLYCQGRMRKKDILRYYTTETSV
jgi:ribosomal protein S6--L-glutamate ligase